MDISKIEDIYPLAPIQQSILSDDVQAPESQIYCGQLRCVLRGKLDAANFECAWRQLIAHHPVLRTSFVWKRVEKALQVVNRVAEREIETVDWRELTPEQQEEETSKLFRAHLGKGLIPSVAPLLRVALCRTGEETYRFALTYHHLILDEASVLLLLKELFAYYESYPTGQRNDSEPNRPYWLYLNWLGQPDASREETFWRQTFEAVESPTLVNEHYAAATARQPEEGPGFEKAQSQLPAVVADALRVLAKQQQLDLDTLALGMWGLLLSRYSGARTVIFGVGLSGRLPELEGSQTIVGPLSNMLPLRLDVPQDASLLLWLQEVQNRMNVLRQFHYSSLAQVRRWSDIPPELPMFESLFWLDEIHAGKLTPQDPGSISIEEVETHSHAPAPLSLSLKAGDDVTLHLTYDKTRFDAETIEYLFGHLQALLEGFVSNPEQKLSDLSLLTPEERQLILHEWNTSSSAYTHESTIQQLFEEQAARTPHAIALESAAVQLTYSQLNSRANQLAHHLRELGVGPDLLVSVCLERSPELVIALLAILKAGAAYLPLDPAYPLSRLSFMLEDAQAPVLLTQPSLLDSLPAFWGQVITLDSDSDAFALQSEENPPRIAVADNLAYVSYTSGSTGAPKGVCVTHRAVARLVIGNWFASLSPEETLLLLAPVTFDASTFELWGSLLNGARLVIMPPTPPTLEQIAQAVAEHGVTTLWLTAGLFHLMVDEGAEGLKGVRQLLAGGDVLSSAQVEKYLAQSPGSVLINGYGPTENTTFTCCHVLREWEQSRGRVPVGKPVGGTEVYILDEWMQAVGVGVVGELYAGGEGLARGYLNRGDLTAERFVPHPYSERGGERLYRTGDLARYVSEGVIEFVGRRDNQVKVRGFRIELNEIETVLSEHASVRDVVVVARQDRGGEKRLVAYVVGEAAVVSIEEELRDYLRERLPDYMMPWAFIELDALPLTPNGKVDRRALPAPDEVRSRSEEEFQPPRTPEEEILAGIWSEVLGVEQIGINDNFFVLGGDSIRSVQVLSKAQGRGLNFTLQQLFHHQTIRELVEVLQITDPVTMTDTNTEPFSLILPEDYAKLPDGVEDAYPLTMLQAGMIFHSEYNPESAVYHDIFTHHLRISLNEEALREAVRQLVSRHVVLRTSFELIRFSEPMQLVYRSVEVPLEIEDLRHLSNDEQEEFVRQWVQAEKRQSFDWTRPPLIRFHAHRRSDDTLQFNLGFHHAILDGWSVASMLTELFDLYRSLAGAEGARDVRLPPAPSFREFVALEKEALASEECRLYWGEKLRDSNISRLPRLYPAKEDDAPRVRGLSVPIPVEVSDALKEFARSNGVPLKSVLLAAHMRVLSLLTGQADVLTGLVSHGRLEQMDGERVLGLFLSTLPFRQRLAGGSWTDLVLAVFDAEREMLPYRRYPLAQLLQERGGQHLFEIAFNYVHFHVLQGLAQFDDIQPLNESTYEETNFTCLVNFSLNLGNSDVRLRLTYDAAQLDDEQMRNVGGYFSKALAAIANEPLARYDAANLLAEEERRQLLLDRNATRADYPRDVCLHQLFEAQAASTPESVALVFDDASLSYRELNERANQLAHHLRALGVKAETRVGIYVERSEEMLVGMLGVLKAGGAYVPLDPQYPQERIAYMISDAQLPVLLTVHDLRGKLPQIDGDVVCLDSDEGRFAIQEKTNLPGVASADNLAYVIYTSGSTGKPKGVQISHAAVVNFLHSMRRQPGLTGADVLLAVTSLSFDIAALELFLPLITGAQVVLARSEESSDGARLANMLAETGATVMQATPATWRMLLDANWRGDGKLKMLCGGETLPANLAAQLLPQGSALWNMYGPTETTIWSVAAPVQREESFIPIAGAIANTQLYVLGEKLEPVPVGVAGELHIGGAGLARGYLHLPELTAQRFIPDSFGETAGGRLYRTGDMVRYLPDGRIEFLGRLDHQVKVRGFRIELGEIEAALAAHDSVKQAIAVARADATGDTRLVAYVVMDEESRDEQAAVRELRGFLKGRLPDYMMPSIFVLLDELPLTPNGKVDRRALPAPEHVKDESLADSDVQLTPVEEVVEMILSGVLGIEHIGREGNFFHLGGHSLLATRLISRVRETFDIELPLRALFENATVAELARVIEDAMRNRSGNVAPPVLPVPRDADMPLSFAQQRLWFLDQLEPGSASYNIPAAFRVTGHLNVVALEQAFSEILRRHEVLRTTFRKVDGQPAQLIQKPRPMRIPVSDLSDLPLEERLATARAFVEENARQPFNLAEDLMLKVWLLRLAEDEYIFSVMVHHIASDGWSIGILISELIALYKSYATGQPSTLEELKIQYGDYAVWQREWMSGEVLEQELGYWRKQLEGAPAVLELPTDRVRPAVQSYRGASETLRLSAEVSEGLRKLSRQEGVTLFMTLLAAFNVLLHRYSHQEDIVVGTPIAGRNRSEIEPLIGFFVNTLALRTQMSGNPKFVELLAQVKEATLGAYAHQEMPFEKLVEELRPAREMSHAPLFQVMLVLQNVPLERLELPEVEMRALEVSSDTAKFDLTLSLIETGQGVFGALEYSADLFDVETARRMARHFEVLVEGVVGQPEARISELPVLTEAEREQLLVEWNETEREYEDGFLSVTRMFERQVRLTPDAAAVEYEGRKLSYVDLNRRANQVAHYLRSLGVKADVPVGIMIERSIEMAVGVLGILKAGGAYVPLDPAYPKERLAFMLNDAAAPVLLTQERLLETLPESEMRVVCLDGEGEGEAAHASMENPACDVAPENLAYVIYTSGSTGRPKGIGLGHGALSNLIEWHRATLQGQANTLQFASLSFDASFHEMFSAWTTGGTLRLISEELRRDVSGLGRYILSNGIEKVILPVVVLQQFAEEFGDQPAAGNLRDIIATGEQLQITPAVVRLFQNRPTYSLHNHYGPSETHVVTSLELTEPPNTWPSHPSIGRPIFNTQLYVLDENLQPVPSGVFGELYIGGDSLARGYINRPELTAEKFIPNPFGKQAGARMYRTGDLARYRQRGEVEFLGRIDHQVKVRGFRVELGEVEAVISQHPNVLEAVVLAREDVAQQRRLVAYVVSRPEGAPSVTQLRTCLQEKLPDYMIPSAFLMLDALPLTPNGKVDRRALPAPDQSRPELAGEFAHPSTVAEKVVAHIWTETLGIERIGINDNFFDLGGHSLLATRVVARLSEVFRMEVPLRALFEKPTVEGIVGVIAEMWGERSVVEEIAEVFLEMENMSEDEVKALMHSHVSGSSH